MRFYEEFINKRKGVSSGNCLVIFEENGFRYGFVPTGGGTGFWQLVYEGVSGIFASPNSPVASTGVGSEYLRTSCKRISKKRAFEIHPELKRYLNV